jgi:hypothetical protein
MKNSLDHWVDGFKYGGLSGVVIGIFIVLLAYLFGFLPADAVEMSATVKVNDCNACLAECRSICK